MLSQSREKKLTLLEVDEDRDDGYADDDTVMVCFSNLASPYTTILIDWWNKVIERGYDVKDDALLHQQQRGKVCHPIYI